MPASFDLVTLDTPDTERAAMFWSAALQLHETQREDGDRWIVLSDETGVRRIGLQKGPARPGTVHLDLACEPSDFDAEVARLLALGAALVVAPRHESYGSIVNLRDPDGNAFDLCAYVDW
jgi:predicted enzyme related to lactoylglutathione lyase